MVYFEANDQTDFVPRWCAAHRNGITGAVAPARP
jgi:hypothetical protein